MWVRNGDDHWAMATTYWRIGIDRFGANENKIIGGETEEIEESPVVYAGNKIDSKFALDKFKQSPKHDWRKVN